MKATIFSTYMSNIDLEVVAYQKKCVEKFLPEGWEFKQICHAKTHPAALADCVKINKNPVTVFLDIDCIPLSDRSFNYLLDSRWAIMAGALVGAAQRANHIANGKHIYVGPFCMAFCNDTYKELGSPDFKETYRGDVGEELTYKWQESGKPVYFLWPSYVQKPMWNLIDNVTQFGYGTVYEDLFYHTFCIRAAVMKGVFVSKCREILAQEEVVA